MEMPAKKRKEKLPQQELSETKEYCESHYYGRIRSEYERYMVKESNFWVDYATACLEGHKPKCFLNQNFTDAYGSIMEIVAALSLLDLPSKSVEHGFKMNEDRSAEWKAISNMIIFQKGVKECKAEFNANIFLAQRYIDSYRNEDEEIKADEFLINHIYTGQVIITNASSRKLECDVFYQIPQGALPVSNSLYQKSQALSLNSYLTKNVEYKFYFPEPGKFTHAPAYVSVDSSVVAKSAAAVLTVLKEKVNISETNFLDVVSTGNQELILNFIKENSCYGKKSFMLSEIYWMLKDKSFFERLIEVLKHKHIYDSTVWSYSFFHKHREDLIIEYIDNSIYIKQLFGYYYNYKLAKSHPLDTFALHLEYYPLMNPRTHKDSYATTTTTLRQPLILNEQLYQTYKKFIFYLIEKPVASFADTMRLCYYLLLQDRVKETLEIFKTISKQNVPKEGHSQLQYDYMAAYLDFFVGKPKFSTAREMAKKYLNYPIVSWRLLFMDIDRQLREYDGEKVEEMVIDEEERKGLLQKKNLDIEAQLDIALDGKEVNIIYSKVNELVVKYYVIDLEILFSRAPFLAKNTEDFSFVQPNSSSTVTLDTKLKECKLKIPEIYSAKNLVIEVNGGGLKRLITYFSSSLKVQIFENTGELKVTDENGKQLEQVYVKAFIMKKTGGVMFYKDGYTDMRGRFDYVTLSASPLERAERFALFISSETHGSLIRECLPPAIIAYTDQDMWSVQPRLVNYYDCTQKKK